MSHWLQYEPQYLVVVKEQHLEALRPLFHGCEALLEFILLMVSVKLPYTHVGLHWGQF